MSPMILASVFRQQRQADAIAGREARDARRQCLESQRDVDRTRDDVEHRVLRLELIHLGQRRGVVLLFL